MCNTNTGRERKSERNGASLLVSGALLTGLGLVSGQGLEFIGRVLLARSLGPTVFGIFALGVSFVTLGIVFVSIGMPTATTRFVAMAMGDGNRRYALEVIIASVITIITAGTIVALALWLLSQYVAILLWGTVASSSLLRLFVLNIPTLALINILISAFQGMRLFHIKVYIQDIGLSLLRCIGYAVVGFLAAGIWGAVTVYVLSTFTVLTTCVFVLYRILSRWPGVIHLQISKAISLNRTLLAFSWPLTLSWGLDYVLWQGSLYLLQHLSGASEVGVYSAAIMVAKLLLLTNTAFAAIYLPMASEGVGARNPSKLVSLYRTSTRYILLLLVPATGVVVIFSREIMNILFGASYISGTYVLEVLALGFFLHSVAGPNDQLLISLGKTRLNLLNAFVASACNIIVGLVLVPLWGALGAAVSFSLSLAFRNFMCLVELWTIIGLSAYESKAILPLMCGVAAIGLGWVIYVKLHVIDLVAVVVLVVGIYWLLCFGVKAIQISEIKAILGDTKHLICGRIS